MSAYACHVVHTVSDDRRCDEVVAFELYEDVCEFNLTRAYLLI